MDSNNYLSDDLIDWQLVGPCEWPEDLEFVRDPGDVASVDCGLRSHTQLQLFLESAQFTCAHAQTTVYQKNGSQVRLTMNDLTRIVLFAAYLRHDCDCFRARWKHMDPKGKFCRAAAIETWRWIERTVGHQNIMPCWSTRTPAGPGWQGNGEVVDDGMCPGSSKKAVPRQWRGR